MTYRRILPCLLVVACVAAAGAVLAQEPIPRLFVRDVVVQGEDDLKLRWPVGVASGKSDELVVIDIHGSRAVLFRFEQGGWQGKSAVELPGSPVAIAHDGNRYMLALRGGQGLTALEGDGLQRRSIPLPGGAVPTALTARPGGGFLVYDALAQEVLSLDTNGTPGNGVPVGPGVTALTASPAGGFFVAVAGTAEVVRYDAQGSEAERVPVPGVGPIPAWPVGIVASSGGGVVVLDGHGNRLAMLDRTGRLNGVGARPGWEPGLLRFPAAMAAVGNGRLGIADTGNGRVQLFRRSSEDGS